MNPFRCIPVSLAALLLLLLCAPCLRAQSAGDDDRERNRIAVLSDPEVSAEADFLAAALSGAGFELLERSDLGALAAEGKLVSGSLPPSLASADGLLLVESVDLQGVRLLATRLVGRDDGRVHAADLRAHEGFESGWAGEIGATLRAFRTARQRPDATLPKVSLQAIREEFVAGRKENQLVGTALTRLVSAELSRKSSFELLERHDLSLVQFERFLTRIDAESFAKADFIVTGTVHRENGSARFEFQVARAGEDGSKKTAATVESEDLPEIAAAMAERLVPLLVGEPGRETRPAPAFLGTDEASRFAAEADRAIRLGLHGQAVPFAETAYLLSDDGDMDRLYLLATAELLSVLPGLRGQGFDISRGIILQVRPDELAAVMFDADSGEEFPLPDQRQWEGLALAAERAADLDRLVRSLSDREATIKRDRIGHFSRELSTLLKEALFNAHAQFGTEIPAFEREMMQRIASASAHGAREILWPYESLLLDSSRERAVERIRDWLYGQDVASLREGGDQNPAASWYRVSSLRGRCYGYFDFKGYDSERGDTASSLIDSRIFQTPFVAWLSGAGMTFDEAFEAAIATAPPEFQLLADIDGRFSRALIGKPGESRRLAFSQLRQAIQKNLAPLRELGMLELYADQLADLEWGRRTSFGDDDFGAFWREVHAAVLANDNWSPGRLTDRLANYFDGQQWTPEPESNSTVRTSFLAALETDWSGNRNPLADSTRRNRLKQIEKAKETTVESVFPDAYAAGTLEGIPESETLELRRAMWGYRVPTLATCVASDGIYQFQHGDASHDIPSRVLQFNPDNPVGHLTVPDEVRALVNNSADLDTLHRVQRIGDIEVDKDRISLAFPGGTAVFDRSSQAWSVTPVPFLAQRSGMAFVGDRVVSYLGASSTGPAPPVQGLYLTSRETHEHFAVVDTSRRPPKWMADMSQRIVFSFPPLAVDGSRFLVGMAGIMRPHAVYHVRLDGDLSDPRKQPVPLPFAAGSDAMTRGAKANGFILFASTRKASKPGRPPGGEGALQVGAFAVDAEGKRHWLLDTGTIPAIGKPPEGAGEWDRRMFMGDEKPLYRFPKEFAIHRGLHCPAPVLHYDGTRLILLTGQFTTDGRRLLYVWKNPNQERPKRLALRFAGFEEYDEIDDEEKRNWNQGARNTISSMFIHDGRLYFEYPRGFFFLSLEELDKAAGE